MLRFWLWVSCLALFIGGAGDLHALRIASWNLHNYGLFDRLIDGKFRSNYPKPEAEKSAIRAVIARVQPDVIALQELGGAKFLKELQKDLKAEGQDYPYSEYLQAADEDRQLAILSKIPFTEVYHLANLTYKTAEDSYSVLRGCLGVTLESPEGLFTLFNVHLKSKLDKPKSKLDAACENVADQRRRGETLAIRKALASIEMNPDVPYLVVGDFNDSYRSPAVQLFMKKGDQVHLKLLPITDSRGEAWTYAYHREDAYTRIDHMLISPALWPWVANSQGVIVDGPQVLQGSDHRMIYMDLLGLLEFHSELQACQSP